MSMIENIRLISDCLNNLFGRTKNVVGKNYLTIREKKFSIEVVLVEHSTKKLQEMNISLSLSTPQEYSKYIKVEIDNENTIETYIMESIRGKYPIGEFNQMIQKVARIDGGMYLHIYNPYNFTICDKYLLNPITEIQSLIEKVYVNSDKPISKMIIVISHTMRIQIVRKNDNVITVSVELNIFSLMPNVPDYHNIYRNNMKYMNIPNLCEIIEYDSGDEIIELWPNYKKTPIYVIYFAANITIHQED